jgi:hypothetical protein
MILTTRMVVIGNALTRRGWSFGSRVHMDLLSGPMIRALRLLSEREIEMLREPANQQYVWVVAYGQYKGPASITLAVTARNPDTRYRLVAVL